VADDPSKAYRWLEKFFFEPPAKSKKKRERGGALQQLNKKIDSIRRGEFADRGIPSDALVLPVVVTFDHVCESGHLYMWLDDECERLYLVSARHGVRPATVLEIEDFEALFALAGAGGGVCNLLMAKTEGEALHEAAGHFLQRKANDPSKLRLPFLQKRFDELVPAIIATVREIEREHQMLTKDESRR
jgi:hypothetical protein